MEYTGRNPWDVLGVAEDAPFSDVKRAYLRRARTSHPDVPGGSNEAFREVRAAFEALQHGRPRPARSTPYDQWLARPPRRARQWTDDDPLGRFATPTSRPASFADLLEAELLRQPAA